MSISDGTRVLTVSENLLGEGMRRGVVLLRVAGGIQVLTTVVGPITHSGPGPD